MNDQPVIGYADAKRAVEAIVEEVARRGKAAVIAVADNHGELLAFARMDGAPLSSQAVAMNKAWTAARTGQPTFEVGRRVRDPQKGFDISYYGDPRYIGWGGGAPVFRNGKVAGAVALSGLPEEEDMEIAAATAAMLEGGQ